MHVRNLFLFGSLAMPIVAMPTPASNVVLRDDVAVEQRGPLIARLYRDLFKREPLVEAIPSETSLYEAVEVEARDEDEDGIELLDETLDDTSSEDIPVSLDERAYKKKPGGASKRAYKKKPGGASKRAYKKKPGGASKRAYKKKPGGASK
ncbi:hypothetical protein COCVIDRAFT_19385 [Bipolaris victoriae FI3]|uniref:Uncharacterized protein n=1 Tax=Bipolaris victoriae (strain FI3) TaxID=930091 RepID=W7E7C5_BIPV3|nr:hypothetical protein COCVIDRAFT_19385 [Bipolaris victoriae FI3]